MKLGYKKSSKFSNVATGPLLNIFSSFLMTRKKAAILARIPRVFNTRAVLVGQDRSGTIFRGAIRLVGSFGSCFVRGGRPVCRGPSPNGGTKNVSALRRGSLNYARGTKASTIQSIVLCNRQLGAGKLGLLDTPKGSLITDATLTSSNYRLILFAAKEKAPFKAFIPAIGISAGDGLGTHGPG